MKIKLELNGSPRQLPPLSYYEVRGSILITPILVFFWVNFLNSWGFLVRWDPLITLLILMFLPYQLISEQEKKEIGLLLYWLPKLQMPTIL